jgi:Phage late control gene D protein (GPD).
MMADYNLQNGYAGNKATFENHLTRFTIWNVYNKELQDVTASVHNIKWITDLEAATQLTFDVMRGKFEFIPWNGDQVVMEWNGEVVFTGWIFKRDLDQDDKWSIVAYPASRYLKGTGTYQWPASSSSDRFVRIAQDIQLPYAVLDANNYKVPAEITDGATFFDMINKPAETARTHTGERFFLLDAGDGTIQHVSTARLETKYLLGDAANVQSWKFSASIEDTSNVVTVTHEDSQTKKRQSYTARDNGTVPIWGPLIHTEAVSDSNVNEAQLRDKAESLLKEKNVEAKSFSLTILGDLKIRAGVSFYVNIWEVSGVGLPPLSKVLVTKATHNFDNPWSVDLEVTVV